MSHNSNKILSRMCFDFVDVTFILQICIAVNHGMPHFDHNWRSAIPKIPVDCHRPCNVLNDVFVFTRHPSRKSADSWYDKFCILFQGKAKSGRRSLGRMGMPLLFWNALEGLLPAAQLLVLLSIDISF